MRLLPVLAFAAAAATATGAANAGPPTGELQNIRNLAGCYEVTYRFVEDGVHDTWSDDYDLGPVKEWVGYKEDPKGAITLPHVSITSDGRAVPHWYEVWSFHPASRTWTQEIWRGAPADEPKELRYRCTAPWKMNRWQCHAGQAPKPFRDSGAPFGFARVDYDVIDRENILLVTGSGWVQNEHNRKLTEAGAVVAYELGWITYRRLDQEHCAVAIDQFPDYTR